jgi:lipopolysaccharide export system permease protein
MRGATPGSTTQLEAIFTLHQRVAGPLMSIFAVLIGYAVLVTSSFSRFGLWRSVLTAVVFLIILRFMEGLCLDYARRSTGVIWVMYLPLIFGFLSTYILILRSDRPWAKSVKTAP